MVLEDVLHAHPISEQRMKEVLGHTPLQARSWPGSHLGFLLQATKLARSREQPSADLHTVQTMHSTPFQQDACT